MIGVETTWKWQRSDVDWELTREADGALVLVCGSRTESGAYLVQCSRVPVPVLTALGLVTEITLHMSPGPTYTDDGCP